MMRISAASKFRDARGFTLLELLVVLAIILIATAIVIPSISNTDSNQFSAQVRQAVSLLNYARRIAIVDSSPKVAVFFVLDPDDPDYSRLKEKLDTDGRAFWESADITLDYRQDIPDPEESSDYFEITFFPEGGSTGGILTFEMGELTASIKVDPLTGRVTTSFFGEDFPDES